MDSHFFVSRGRVNQAGASLFGGLHQAQSWPKSSQLPGFLWAQGPTWQRILLDLSSFGSRKNMPKFLDWSHIGGPFCFFPIPPGSTCFGQPTRSEVSHKPLNRTLPQPPAPTPHPPPPTPHPPAIDAGAERPGGLHLRHRLR